MNELDTLPAKTGATTSPDMFEDEKREPQRVPPVYDVRSKQDASPFQEDAFSFVLRGEALNPLIDATSSLMALVLRLFTLSQYDDIDDLHKRCRHEIEAIELELHKQGFDRVTILAHRYCLCSVLDETVMCTPWGQDSNWSERSLLALFHDETWGGEKFFVILERLVMEPARYLPIIEFLYLCLCLGYEGKYRVMHNGRVQVEALIREVHDVIRKQRGNAEALSLNHGQGIVDRLHHVAWQTPVAMVAAGAALLGLIVYLGFFFYTESYTDGVIAQLSRMLNR